MSMNMVQYPPAQNLPLTRADVAIKNTDSISIATSETTLAIVKDLSVQTYSFFENYFDVTFGSATNVKIRYYFSPDFTSAQAYNTATWFEIPLKTASTGVLSDTPLVLDSTSPAQSTNIRTVDELHFGGAMAFKITGQATASAATLNGIWVIGRVG